VALLSKLRRDDSAKQRSKSFDLYYASDVHGSEQCWRKFLGAGRFYDVSALIMGGDLTGKAIVPIVRGAQGELTAMFMGERRTARSDEGNAELINAIRYNGMYPWLTTQEELDRHKGSEELRDKLFEEVMLDELRRWIDLADERMATYGIDVFVMAGNDDPWACDRVLESASHVQACDDRVVQVGPHEMISCCYANPTPWDSPRELDEDALFERIDKLAQQLERPSTAIFNLHVPPHGSGLDNAIEVDRETLTYVYNAGVPNEMPVGSRAVREIIEKYQPALSLHGHIHESRGEARIGRTLALNSGSEYNSGRIHGVVVKLDGDRVAQHQFVVG
jgi:Icc-related predicted phosphoesterase